MTLVGKKAPKWSATAYVAGEEKTISSADYKGQYYVLYWYPLDFTFVCPTEIREFERLAPKFAEAGAAVIGASTDSWFSHDAWFKDTEIFADGVTHPVIADTNHRYTKKFGALKKEAGIAYRATVIVDDKGIVRMHSVNDLEVGRSPEEVLRTVEALQSGGLCGIGWHKGDDFVA